MNLLFRINAKHCDYSKIKTSGDYLSTKGLNLSKAGVKIGSIVDYLEYGKWLKIQRKYR